MSVIESTWFTHLIAYHYEMLFQSYPHSTDKWPTSVVCGHTVSNWWWQGSNAGHPNLNHVLPSPTVCTGPVSPWKTAWACSKCWQASRVGPSNNNPRKSVQVQANQHPHLQTRFRIEYGSLGTIKRAPYICLKVKHFWKHLLEIVCCWLKPKTNSAANGGKRTGRKS